MNELRDIVATIGFPAGVAAFVLWRLEKHMLCMIRLLDKLVLTVTPCPLIERQLTKEGYQWQRSEAPRTSPQSGEE